MKVLFTTDGSESAENAIRWYSRLPMEHNPCCDVMTVAWYQVYGLVSTEVREEFVLQADQHAKESYERAANILKNAGIEARHVKKFGQPADVITEFAREGNIDLVVVGAHGQSMIERMLIGSTSESVARHAPCSVLIVRDDSPANTTDNKGLKVTITTDCSDVDRQISAQLNALHLSNDTHYRLVSVIEHPYLLEPSVEYDSQLTKETVASMERLARELSRHSDFIETHTFEKMHVASCILDFLGHHPSDLLVVGDKGRSAIGRFFLGSVSRVLLHHAPCSVLIVRKKL